LKYFLKISLCVGSIVYNKPDSFYENHKTIIWTTISVGFTLVFLIILLFINIERREKTENDLQKANEELRKHQEQLESLVEERTLELTRVNKELEDELVERKQAEAALEVEKRRLFTVLDIIPGLVYLQARDYSIPFANARFHEAFGDPKGRLCYEVIHGRSEPCEKCPTFRVFETNAKEIWEWTSQDNKKFMIIDEPFPGIGNDEMMVLEMAIDITEQKQAEKLIADTQKLFEAVIEQSPIPMVVASQTGDLLIYNQACVEQLKWEDEPDIKPGVNLSTMKKTWDDYDSNGNYIPMSDHPLPMSLKGKVTKNLEIRIVRNDGSERWEIVNAAPIYDDEGNIIAGFVTFPDITERIQAEELIKSSLKEKEVLLQEIHHRVKNNMQVIISLLKLQSGNIMEKQYLDMFKESQHRIKSMALVHEKLYQTKNLADIDFKGYVKSLVTSLFRSYRPRQGKITLKIEVGDVSLGLERAIPCGLIINELVSNSLKYAFPEERAGEIRVAFNSTDENTLVLEVSDNGIGIPEKLDFRNTKFLGLHLVTILSEDQLHGTIELNRTDGTDFRIRLKNIDVKKRYNIQ